MCEDTNSAVLEEAGDEDAAWLIDYRRRRDAEHAANEPTPSDEDVRRERLRRLGERSSYTEQLGTRRAAQVVPEPGPDELDLRTTQEIAEEEELRERIAAPYRRQAEAMRAHIAEEKRRAIFAAVVPRSVPAVLAGRYHVAPCTRRRGAGRPQGAPSRATSAGGRSDPAEPEPGEHARRAVDDVDGPSAEAAA